MSKVMLTLLVRGGALLAQPVLRQDYRPASSLVAPIALAQTARFRVIDFHAPRSSMDPRRRP